MISKRIVGLGLALAGLCAGSLPSAQCPASELEKISPGRHRRNDLFPWSIDLEKGRALVGILRPTAPSEGVAFVLERCGDHWCPAGALLPTNPAIVSLGSSVAIDGDFAAVSGAELQGVGSYAPRVLLFQHARPCWSEIAELSSPTPLPLDRYGNALDMDGPRLAVGAYGDGEQATDAGAVFMYRYDGSAWRLEQKLFAPVRGRGFGRSVEVDGDRLLVGDFATAWAFVWDGSRWVDDGRLRGSDIDPRNNDNYADTLALSGDRALIGARFHRHGRRDGGGAYIFLRTPSGWIEEAHLLPDPAHTNAEFGQAVAIRGAVALVSEYAGAAYLYGLEPSGWTLAARPYGSDSAQQTAGFGYQLAFDGSDALITCPDCDLIDCGPRGCETNGAIYAFEICSKARLETRNAGSNPPSLRGTPARLGQHVELQVDLATTGHALALPFAFESKAERTLRGGQVLLAADGGHGLLFHLPPQAGPLAAFDFAVPSSVGLLGFAFSVQALHYGGVTPFALSNALDFVIGEF